jgi:hypothetical protein
VRHLLSNGSIDERVDEVADIMDEVMWDEDLRDRPTKPCSVA